VDFIKTHIEAGIGTIALDHYAKRNALSERLIEEMLEAFEQFRQERVRVVVLRTATPQKIWSAGHSVDELPTANRDPLPYDDALEVLLRAVSGFPAPVIALVQGSAWGGACELIMTCDMVYGDETCGFAITPAKLGLPFNISGVLHFLNRLPLNIVMEMFSTANLIDAERALHLGIVNELIPAAELEAHVYKVAHIITTRSSAAIASFKTTALALAQAAPIDPVTFERIHGLRRQVYMGPDYAEGVAAFIEKRPAVFK
jgi:methylmalonyl-CoA decarboxylase